MNEFIRIYRCPLDRRYRFTTSVNDESYLVARRRGEVIERVYATEGLPRSRWVRSLGRAANLVKALNLEVCRFEGLPEDLEG